jgi:hypothetical protein
LNPDSELKPASPGADFEEAFGFRRFATVLGGLILLVFFPVLAGGQSFFFRDYGVFGYPLALYHRDCFWRGEIPLWNPLTACGSPFLAQWNTMTLYPGALLYLLPPLPWSLSFFCVAHLFLGGCGMWFLAKKLTNSNLAAAFSGIAFSFAGLTLSFLIWPNCIATLAWMPVVIATVRRAALANDPRSLAIAAGAGTMQMLTGGAEYILFTWLVALVVVFGEKEVRWKSASFRLGILGFLVAAASAAQLLPFFELLGQSSRGSGEVNTFWSLPLDGICNFLVPSFKTDFALLGVPFRHQQIWMSSYYVGIPTIFLALTLFKRRPDRRSVVLGVTALGCLALACGDATPIYRWVNHLLPLGFMRFPVKFVIPTTVILMLLAAEGLNRLRAKPPGKQEWLTLALLLAATLAGGFMDKSTPVSPSILARSPVNGVIRAGILLLFASGLILFNKAENRSKRFFAGGLMVLLPFLDGATHLPWQNPTIPSAAFAPGLAKLDPRPKIGESRATESFAALKRLSEESTSDALRDFLMNRLGLRPNLNIIEGVPVLTGFQAMVLSRHYDALLTRNADAPGQPMERFLGVTQRTAPGRVTEWISPSNAMPLITLGGQPVFLDDNETLRELSGPNFVPEKIVYLPEAARGVVSAEPLEGARVLRRAWKSHRIEIEIETPRPSVLVVAQPNYPSWHASVDGQAARIWNANHAYQAVAVPAGKHVVLFRYVDRLFLAGAVISIFTLTALAVAFRKKA